MSLTPEQQILFDSYKTFKQQVPLLILKDIEQNMSLQDFVHDTFVLYRDFLVATSTISWESVPILTPDLSFVFNQSRKQITTDLYRIVTDFEEQVIPSAWFIALLAAQQTQLKELTDRIRFIISKAETMMLTENQMFRDKMSIEYEKIPSGSVQVGGTRVSKYGNKIHFPTVTFWDNPRFQEVQQTAVQTYPGLQYDLRELQNKIDQAKRRKLGGV